MWIGLGLLAILVKTFTAHSPEWVEQYYSTRFFHGIRLVLDHTIGLLPFASLYLLILLLLSFLGRGIWKLFKGKGKFINRLLNTVFTFSAVLGGVLFFFQLLWGYNYNRLSLESHIGLVSKNLEKEELEEELAFAVTQAIHYRLILTADTSQSFTPEVKLSKWEKPIQAEVEKMLTGLGYPDSGNPRLRFLYPKGSLLVWNTAGFYNPLTGECQVDPGLHPLKIPFVMAHEFCHAYGFTDEGYCNFLAWLACIQSDEPLLQYSAHLTYWRYLVSAYRRNWREASKGYLESLPSYFVADIRAIDEFSNAYPEFFPEIRYVAYDTYLKSQGVKEGMKSYSRMVLLCSAWRKKQAGLQ